MGDWTGFRNWARGYYKLEDDEDEWFSLIVTYDEEERSPLAFAPQFQYLDEAWVQIRTVVCDEDELSPKVALKKNAEYGIVGVIGLDDGRYQLFQSMPLADLAEGDFDAVLKAVAAQADLLEEQDTGGDAN